MTPTPENVKDFLADYRIGFSDNGFITASSIPTIETFVELLTEYATLYAAQKSGEAYTEGAKALADYFSMSLTKRGIEVVVARDKETYLSQTFPDIKK